MKFIEILFFYSMEPYRTNIGIAVEGRLYVIACAEPFEWFDKWKGMAMLYARIMSFLPFTRFSKYLSVYLAYDII